MDDISAIVAHLCVTLFAHFFRNPLLIVEATPDALINATQQLIYIFNDPFNVNKNG